MKKKISEVLEFLGKGYTIEIIDYENVIYYKISDLYDIEVSGLDNSKKSFDAMIYIWELKPGKRIVERIGDISSKEKLKEVLTEVIKKYK